MIAETEAGCIVQAWLGEPLDVAPTAWPRGAYFVGPDSRDDYLVFVVTPAPAHFASAGPDTSLCIESQARYKIWD